MATRKKLAIVLITAAFQLPSAALLAAEPNGTQAVRTPPEHQPAVSPTPGDKALDALVVRPVTFLTSLFSAGVFIASLPFTPLDSGTDVGTARKALVDYPFGYTFTRPLGDFGGPSTSGWPGTTTVGTDRVGQRPTTGD